MKKFLTAAIATALMAPAGAMADQRFQVGKVYICTVEALQKNSSLCARVKVSNPTEDLCVRVADRNRFVISPVRYTSDNRPACTVPVGFVPAGSGATASGGGAAAAGVGGLAGGGAGFAAVLAAGALAAAAGGGSSNGTN